MVTDTYLNLEKDLGARVFLYYSDKAIEYAIINSDKFYKWYIDSMELDLLSSAMSAIYIVDDELFIGDTEIDLNFFRLLGSKIREYYKATIDNIYPEGSIIDPTDDDPEIPITPPTVVPYLAAWRKTSVTITQDATTTVILPFNVDNIDINSLSIWTSDTSPGEDLAGAYTIVDGSIIWDYYFDLNTGDIIYMNYLQTQGL